ncbi:MAG: S1 family peptidase, partial [Alphaproteobacteria bacterium]|nr:S1 family peptidase [Alphaproteobacteria bacterium]
GKTTLDGSLSDQLCRSIQSRLIMLFAFMAISFIAQIESVEAKTPDLTDYTTMYKEIFEKIINNEDLIKNEMSKIEDKSDLKESDIAISKKTIQEKQMENIMLWNQAREIERLNIESYKLDIETQKIFDEAEEVIRHNFLGINGVYDLFTEKKYRKIVVFIDPDDFASSDYMHGITNFIDDIKKSVGVDVEVNVSKSIELHSTGCPRTTGPCQPARGGIQISHQDTSGSGSTLGFKALHKNHGHGFIIAGHEAVAINTKIVQPRNGDVIGVVKAISRGVCDCAFVKSTGGHTMNDVIWVDGRLIYPIVSRSATHPVEGEVSFTSSVNGLKVGHIIATRNPYGQHDSRVVMRGLAEEGDSGSPVFGIMSNGNAKIYGMVSRMAGPYVVYSSYDYIKSELNLQW